MNEKKFYLRLVLISIAVGAAVFIFLMTFNVKETDISGTQYSTKEEILKWLEKENGTVNSLYAMIKINYMDPVFPPVIEDIHALMIKPWHISLKVREKKIAGYVDYYGNYLCFDDEGTAMMLLPEGTDIEGAVYVKGLKIDWSKVSMGKSLPVSDGSTLEKIAQASRLLKKYGLAPEGVTCEKNSLKLQFPSIEVLLGKSAYEKKIAQLPPILKKLSEKYSGVKGTLHLENFDSGGESVRFVPETGKEP